MVTIGGHVFQPYTQQPFQNPYATAQVAAGRLANMPALGNPYSQPNMQPVQPVSELQFVNGRESADMYAMPPNSKTILMDSTMARFYLKETDASGMARVTAYDFTPATDAPSNEYLTRAEFEEWKAQHEPATQPAAVKPAAKRTAGGKQADAE